VSASELWRILTGTDSIAGPVTWKVRMSRFGELCVTACCSKCRTETTWATPNSIEAIKFRHCGGESLPPLRTQVTLHVLRARTRGAHP
jgi:hypothetical protein